MAVKSLTYPSAAEAQKVAFNGGYARGGFNSKQDPFEVVPGEKWACVMLKLHESVTSSDYPTLKSAITDITGIQDVRLVIDMPVLPVLEDGVAHEYIMVGEINVRIQDVPKELPE